MKLIDFGFAKTFDETTEASTQGLSTTTKGIGAGIVQAPEMINEKLDFYDERVDVWYIGCLALIMFSNDIHKVAKTKEYWFVKATAEKQKPLQVKNLHNITLEAINFINKAMRFDYKKRPKAPELLEDIYFKIDIENKSTLGMVIDRNE